MQITNKYLYVVRAYGVLTLYDRLSTRPYLSDVEKLWLAFQLLCALEECEHAHVCHGDIKSQNVLVSSRLSVQLTDFAGFKPVLLPDVRAAAGFAAHCAE
jgi:phosphoinositide-3-kinase regulatory subunit 4